ncbi:hypothetical protein HBH95_195830 [Parastagonospora nodorum]|nr:hypothetical protein HBH95_195830 [Parastagonospora nodorum]
MDLDFVTQTALTALLNPRSLALKRPALSSSDLNCRRTDPTIATLPAKRIKTDEDYKKSTHCQGFNGSSSLKLQKTIRDNIEELIYVSKVKHTYVLFCRAGNNCNNLNIIVTNSTSREFSRVDIKSSTRLCSLIDRAKLLRPVFKLQRYNYYNLQDSDSLTQIQADVANVFDTVVSKLDKVPTRELSSYIKTELLRDNSRKFYYLVITSKDTHCKQIIKKAYIILLERALLILFII